MIVTNMKDDMTKAERLMLKLKKVGEIAEQHRARKLGQHYPLQESAKPELKGTNTRGSTSRKSR